MSLTRYPFSHLRLVFCGVLFNLFCFLPKKKKAKIDLKKLEYVFDSNHVSHKKIVHMANNAFTNRIRKGFGWFTLLYKNQKHNTTNTKNTTRFINKIEF